VIGIAVASSSFSAYLPIGHKHGDNMDREMIIEWMKNVVSINREYIFHNAPYDLGWLRTLGIIPKGTIRDTAIIQSLINEEMPGGYSLDNVSKHYLKHGKDEKLLRAVASEWGIDPKAEMWKLPAKYVGPYAEIDAKNTLEIYLKQLPLIYKDELTKVFELESKVTPIIVDMNWRGIRVDVEKAIQLNEEWLKKEKELRASLGNVDIWSTQQLAKLLDKEGVSYPHTDKGNPSITKDFLNANQQPILKRIQHVRELNRLRNIFVYDNIVTGNINGRVHPNFLQVAVEGGGTRTGRFSCRNPNIQQIPKRSSLVDAKRIRSLYIADDGMLWANLDYSSQEPRMQIHYGIKKGYKSASEAKDVVEGGKKLYAYIEEACPEVNYDQAKAIVLGRSYGMGKAKMAETIGVDEEECEQILESFDNNCPFIGDLARRASEQAGRAGFVRTILGRRRRFNYWVPAGYQSDNPRPIYGKNAAQAVYGEVERDGTNKAFNAVIQGSCADQTKLALVAAVEAGLTPVSTVHDEINFVVSNEQEGEQAKQIMENTIELEIKTEADLELKEHW
jgi:DNA polymerase I-like protein with 3'-5' exonuclease and polymerase domains